MPYKRRTRSRKRSKKQYKPNPFRRSPLPFRFPTKLKYESVFSLNPTTGGVDVDIFSANGLFDPNISGVGHQPRGFDQIMPLYDHYTVIGSKIRCVFLGTSGNVNAVSCFVALRDSVTTETTLNDYLEGTKCYKRTLIQTTVTTGKEVCRSTFSPKRFLGISSPMSSSILRGTASANPSEQAYYHIGIGGVSTGVDPGACLVQCSLEYLVIFTEPKNPAQS